MRAIGIGVYLHNNMVADFPKTKEGSIDALQMALDLTRKTGKFHQVRYRTVGGRNSILDESHVKKYWELKQMGKSEATIAEEITDYPVSTTTLLNWKKKYNIKSEPIKYNQKLNDSHVPIYLKHKEKGVRDTLIAYYMGVHESTLKRFKRAYGLTGGKQK